MHYLNRLQHVHTSNLETDIVPMSGREPSAAPHCSLFWHCCGFSLEQRNALKVRSTENLCPNHFRGVGIVLELSWNCALGWFLQRSLAP